MYLVVLLYACFASVFTIGKVALVDSDPLFFVGSRMSLAGVLLVSYSLITQGFAPFKLDRYQWASLITLGAFNIYLTNALEFWALKYLTSTKTCFFYSLSPFVAALGSYLFFRESMSSKKWLGLFIGFMGFAPVIFGTTDGDELGSFLIFSWPEIAILAAVVASATGWLLLKQATQTYKVEPFVANGMSMILGGMMTLANSFVSETWDPVPSNDITTFLLCSFALMAISNFFCYNLYAYLFKKFSATFISFAGFITPAFTATYGFIFLSEEIPLIFYPSYAVVCLGIFLFYQEELRAPVAEIDQIPAN